jgi:hypothetical protein
MLEEQAQRIKELELKNAKLEKAIIILTKSLCTCSDDDQYRGGHFGICCIREVAAIIEDEDLKEKAQR